MKNIKKVLAVMTAVSAFAASTSAFAETTYKATAGVESTEDLFTYAQAEYNEEGTLTAGNSITVKDVPDGALSGEMTLLVLDHDAVLTNVADGDILYIDQGTYTAASGETAATNPEFVGKALGLKVDDLLKAVDTTKAGVYSYPVKVGYYTTPTEEDPDGFAIADGNIVITVSEVQGEEKKTVTVVWGNIDGDAEGKITTSDAADILTYVANGAAGTGYFPIKTEIKDKVKGWDTSVSLIWGNIDGDAEGKITTSDAADLLTYVANGAAGTGSFDIKEAIDVFVE